MNILITGGAGFIGSHLADKLSLNNNVTIVDNLSTGNVSNIHNSKFYLKDINENLNDIFEKENIEYVFHLAAFINLRDSFTNPKECFNANVQGSLNLIETCKKYNIKKFIFSSTGGAIYSEKANLPWNENTEANPKSPYGLSKLTIEKYLEMSGLNYSILRYSNVYGPRQNAKGEAGVISIFIDKIKENKTLSVFGDGNQTRDFIFVSDVVDANVSCLKDKQSNIYNVSTNVETSINEIIKYLNYNKINYLNKIDGEVTNTKLDNLKLKSIGWNPKISIEEGLKLTSAWFN